MHRILRFAKKHEELLQYLVFGFLTTVVNYLVYYPLHNSTPMLAAVANIIAWIAAVIFAFVTNKHFVFKSKDWSLKVLTSEAVKFVSARVGSLIVETAIIFVTVDIMTWNGNYMKIVTSVLVVIMNYVASKLFVFKKDP